MSDVGKVFNKNTDDTQSAKEHTYFWEVGTRIPANNFVDPTWVWDGTFGGADMAYHGDLACA